MESELAIEVTGLSKSYGAVRVLDGLDLRVGRGTVFALLGPNGAGKTTTVRILATLTRADAGQARVAGFDVAAEPGQVRRSISLTGQFAAVDGLQTGAENLRMMARLSGLRGRAAAARARLLLDQFGLGVAADRRVASYSGGMRRRLDLAASLVADPPVIFLDEPTTGLDLTGRQQLWDVVTGLAAAGRTVVLTTQYLEEADLLADRVAVLDAGRVAAEGSPAELKQQVAGPRLDVVLAGPQDFSDAARRLGRRACRLDPASLTIGVPTDGSAAQIRALLDEIDPGASAIRRFAVHSPTLDDVFLALTGHSAQPAKESADV